MSSPFSRRRFLAGMGAALAVPALTPVLGTSVVQAAAPHSAIPAPFGLGAYHISWAAPGTWSARAARREADASALLGLGVSTLWVPLLDEADLPGLRRLSARCAARGGGLIIEDLDPASLASLVADPPPGWWGAGVMDDVTAERAPQARLAVERARAAGARTWVSYAPTLWDRAAAADPRRAGADAVTAQLYPLDAQGRPRDPLDLPFTATLRALEPVPGAAPLEFWAAVQAYSPRGGRLPSGAQVRLMTLMTLAAGARGALLYAALDPSTVWNEDVRAAVRSVARDLRLHGAALRTPRLPWHTPGLCGAHWPEAGLSLLLCGEEGVRWSDAWDRAGAPGSVGGAGVPARDLAPLEARWVSWTPVG